MKRILLTFFVLTFSTFSFQTFAGSLCCQVSSNIQESIGVATAADTGKFSIQLNYSFTHMEDFWDGSKKRGLSEILELRDLSDPMKTRYSSLPVEMDMKKYTLTIGYGISPKISTLIAIPYIKNTMDMRMNRMRMPEMWMDHKMGPVEDLGDITLMIFYRLTHALSAGIGIKSPTGEYKKETTAGTYVHAVMQPGTGSWDPIFSLRYRKAFSPLFIQADGTYQLTTENPKGYEFGDSLSLNLSGNYSVISWANFIGALNFLHTQRSDDRENRYRGNDPTRLIDYTGNTGLSTLWLSPGIQLTPFKNSIFELKFQYPIWWDVNGIQQVADYRVVTGLSYNF